MFSFLKYILFQYFFFTYFSLNIYGFPKHNLTELKQEVKEMFDFAYNNYMKLAYPYDELRPLTCDGHDTWGGFSLTLIDALDTLVIMGKKEEFRKAVELVLAKTDVDRDRNVSVFETNIRVVGGLLSAHLLAKKGGMTLEAGWPCTGPLLRLSEAVARRLLPAFNTSTGMPYGTVNLRHGVPPGETPVTCTAGVTTFIVEFGALSRLTGDPVFENVALRALRSMWQHRSALGLVGNHIDVLTGKWTAVESGIGSGVDSYFEYLLKGSVLLRSSELKHMFDDYVEKIDKYVRHDDWHFWVKMDKGSVTQPYFQSLESFWPGVLTMSGDLDRAVRTLHNYHQVWKTYGALPEFYNVPKFEPVRGRSSYPLRPELVESIMYVFQATRDPSVLQMAVDVLRSIQTISRTSCGFATVHDVRGHQLENRMESFLLSETLKYLYLVFEEDDDGSGVERVPTVAGGECVLGAGRHVFNTEAHPVDPGALYCCQAAGYYSDLVRLDRLHRQYPLLRWLHVSEAELALASSSAASVPPVEPVYARDQDQLTAMMLQEQDTQLHHRHTVLGCPNSRFHYRFLLYGQTVRPSVYDNLF